MVWLIPIVGFSVTLKFSYQENKTKLHKTLFPKFVSNWVYDETKYKHNKIRDDNELKCQTGFRTFRWFSYNRLLK